MVRRYLIAAALVFCGAAPAALPRLQPSPPGDVVQRQTVYLSGEGMSSRWTAVLSKRLAGRTSTQAMYQWYLSIYAPPEGEVAKLAMRAPGTSSLLSKVTRTPDGQMYFPFQSAAITGAAELERAGVQDLVFTSHESGADCGGATVTILGAGRNGRVETRAQFTNYCSLEARIVRDGSLQAVQLRGPYYKANSPVCCPAKPSASAILRYRGGRWVLTPAIFPRAPAHRP